MRTHYFGRRTSNREVPTLALASLPDLIFTVLFFFIIVTHMRTVNPLVQYEVPQGTQVQKMGHKGSIIHLYVGRLSPTATGVEHPAFESNCQLSIINYQSTPPPQFYLQIGNQIGTLDDLPSYMDAQLRAMSTDDQAHLTVQLSADQDVPMSIISSIKQALQQQHALRISYAAAPSPAPTDSQ